MAELTAQEQKMADEFARKIYEKGSLELAQKLGKVEFDLILARTQLNETQMAAGELQEQLQKAKLEIAELKDELAAKKKPQKKTPKADLEIGG